MSKIKEAMTENYPCPLETSSTTSTDSINSSIDDYSTSLNSSKKWQTINTRNLNLQELNYKNDSFNTQNNDEELCNEEFFHSCRTRLSLDSTSSWVKDGFNHEETEVVGCAPIRKLRCKVVTRVGRWVHKRRQIHLRNKQQEMQSVSPPPREQQDEEELIFFTFSKKKKSSKLLRKRKKKINPSIEAKCCTPTLCSSKVDIHRNKSKLSSSCDNTFLCFNRSSDISSQKNNKNRINSKKISRDHNDCLSELLDPFDNMDTSEVNEEYLDKDSQINPNDLDKISTREQENYFFDEKNNADDNFSLSNANRNDNFDTSDDCDVASEELSSSVRNLIEAIESKPNEAMPMPKPQSFLNSFLDTHRQIEDKLLKYYNNDGCDITRPRKSLQKIFSDWKEEKAKDSPPTRTSQESLSPKPTASRNINNKGPVADKAFNDILKIVFVGAPCAGKSSIIRKLLQQGEKDNIITSNEQSLSPEEHSKRPIGVDIYSWDPLDNNTSMEMNNSSASSFLNLSPKDENDDLISVNEHNHIKYSIWDLPGGTEHTGTNEAAQSLFFSSNTLFVLVWDMGATNRKTLQNKNNIIKNNIKNNNTVGQCDSSDESSLEGEESDNDYFLARETANRKSDRALERDIHEKVIFWIECIRKRGGSNSAIMPVATFEDKFDEIEAHRRCTMMKKCILRNQKQQQQQNPSMEFIFAANNDIPRVSSKLEGGTDRLKQAIMNMTSIAPLVDGHIFGNHLHGKIPTVTTSVEKVLDKLIKKREKVVSVDRVRNILRETYSGKITPSNVKESLIHLSSVGKILYFSAGPSSDYEYVLSHFVILNPSWLVSAIECILQPNLKTELMETRNRLNSREFDDEYPQDLSFSFINEQDNPVITTSQDITMMWESMEFMLDVRNKLFTPSTPSLFLFLKCLMVHCGIIVPFQTTVTQHTSPLSPCLTSHFFLPSHLPRYSADFWSFKSKDAWKTTLCHTWQISKSAPVCLMQDITVSILENFMSKHKSHLNNHISIDPHVRVRQVCEGKETYHITINSSA